MRACACAAKQGIALTRRRRVSGGGEQHRSGDKKGKAFNPALLTVGPLADAIAELRAIVVQVRCRLQQSPCKTFSTLAYVMRRLQQAPLPPADQKRKCMTPAMMEGLDKIKALIAVYAELPRGLTTKLLEFMDPFAGVSTLRRRLGQDRDDDAAPVAVAVPPPAPVAVAAAAPAAAALPEQAGGAAAAPKVRRRCLLMRRCDEALSGMRRTAACAPACADRSRYCQAAGLRASSLCRAAQRSRRRGAACCRC